MFPQSALVAAVNLEARRVRSKYAAKSRPALVLTWPWPRQFTCRSFQELGKRNVVAERQANSNPTSSFTLTCHVSIVRIRRRSGGSAEGILAMPVSSPIRASFSGRHAACWLRVAQAVSPLGASAFHHDFISARLQQPTIQSRCALCSQLGGECGRYVMAPASETAVRRAQLSIPALLAATGCTTRGDEAMPRGPHPA